MNEYDARFDVEPTPSNHFAWLRTQLGLERTLMAAVRTSVSLIGFGFTVAQFFERLRASAPEAVKGLRPEMPRNFGLLLIAAGVLSLAVFTWQYNRGAAYLRNKPFTAISGISEKPMHTSTYLTSFVVMLIGTVAFVSVFARF